MNYFEGIQRDMMKTLFTFLKSNGYILLLWVAVVVYASQNGFGGDTAQNRLGMAVAAALLSVVYGILRGKYPSFSLRWVVEQKGRLKHGGLFFYLAAFLLVALGAMNYYRFDSKNLLEERNYDDITYYYLNSKYFEELGYTNLYAAMLVADNEGPKRFSRVRQFRDLRNYEVKPVAEAFRQREEIKGLFSDARWKQFSHEINYISGKWKGGDWRYLFSDHGYNPPPTWTLVGGFFARLCPVETIKIIASIDIVLVLAMFVAILWAFGIDVFIFAFLFYVTTLSGHWPMVGQALLRFDWLAGVVIGMVLFKKEKHAASGAALVYAGLMRLFPMVFFLPFAVAILRDLFWRRTLQRKYLYFMIGAAAMASVLVGGAFARYGADAFVASKEKMALHAGPDSYSSHRVGLGDAMIFHGETDRGEMSIHGGTLGKAEEIRARMPYLTIIALGMVAFLVVLQLRTKDVAYRFMPLCVAIIFIMTTPQVNYFNIRILLFIWSVYWFKPWRSTTGLFILFGTEAVARYCDMSYLRYNATSWSSVGLTVYFVFVVFSHAKEVLGHWFGKDAVGGNSLLKGVSPFVAMAFILTAFSVPHWYYRHGEDTAVAPLEISLDALVGPGNEGDDWDAPNHVVMEKNKGVLIALPNRVHKQRVSISLDGNDRYTVIFYNGSDSVKYLRLKSRRGQGKGMRVHRITLPREVAEEGFDKIRILPTSGDDAYSIGHLKFLE